MSQFSVHHRQEGIGHVFHLMGEYVFNNFTRLLRSIISHLLIFKAIISPYIAPYLHYTYHPWMAAIIVSLLAYINGLHVWILNFVIVIIGFAVGFILVLLSGYQRPFKKFEGLQAVNKILNEKTVSYSLHYKAVILFNVSK